MYAPRKSKTAPAEFLTVYTVEWLRATAAFMASPQYDHLVGILLHPVKCDRSGHIHARHGRTCMFPPS